MVVGKAMGGNALAIDGAGGVKDLPSDLSVAIDQALRIGNWFENLVSEEIPPQWMWTLEWELEEWFKGVEAARDAKYNRPAADTDELEGPTMGNELAERIRGR